MSGAVRCRRCRYDLRGSGAGGVCPECGLAVAESMGGRLLRFADERWVRGQAVGLRLLHAAGVAALLVLMAEILRVFGPVRALFDTTGEACAAAWVVTIGLAAAAAWLMGRPEPGGEGTGVRGWTARATLTAGVLLPVPRLVDVTALPVPQAVWTVAVGLGLLGVAAGVAALADLAGERDRRVEFQTADSVWSADEGPRWLLAAAGVLVASFTAWRLLLDLRFAHDLIATGSCLLALAVLISAMATFGLAVLATSSVGRVARGVARERAAGGAE